MRTFDVTCRITYFNPSLMNVTQIFKNSFLELDLESQGAVSPKRRQLGGHLLGGHCRSLSTLLFEWGAKLALTDISSFPSYTSLVEMKFANHASLLTLKILLASDNKMQVALLLRLFGKAK